MKRPHLYAALALGAAFAITVAVFAGKMPLFGVVKAAESPYTITDSEYECSILESYDIGTGWSYSHDKPLGANSLPAHIYGDKGPIYKSKVTYNLKQGINKSLEWKFSALQVDYSSADGLILFKLVNNSSDYNIMSSTSFPAESYPDESAIGTLASAWSNCTRAGVMFTSTAIDSVEDISVYWRGSYTQRFGICYQLDGETEWKMYVSKYDNIDDSIPMKGNITGSRGWDSYGYTTFNSSSWTTHELYRKKAKIGFVIGGAVSGSLQISAVAINSSKAAVRYLNELSYQEGACTDGALFDLRKNDSEGYHAQSLFQFATERATGSFLGGYNVAGTKTSETNSRGLYNYLVTAIPGLGSVK